MKLRTVRVREFKSIWDSNTFEIDRVTCLVGKNEAGKTALLQALYRLNPIIDDEGNFDVTDDYPRSEVEDYQMNVESGRREPAVVVEAIFELEAPELGAINEEYGEGILTTSEVVVSKGYVKDESGTCTQFVSVPVVESVLVNNLIGSFDLPKTLEVEAKTKVTLAQLSAYLIETGQKQTKQSPQHKPKQINSKRRPQRPLHWRRARRKQKASRRKRSAHG